MILFFHKLTRSSRFYLHFLHFILKIILVLFLTFSVFIKFLHKSSGFKKKKKLVTLLFSL